MTSPLAAYAPGRLNLITDVPGLHVGHATDDEVCTGVTVLTCSTQWTAAVDVRGGGPGSRETDALAPENLVAGVHALVLAGGSVFGLGAADGVTAALSSDGVGLRLKPGSPAIPIVGAAVLHDLGNEGNKQWGLEPPYRQLGIAARSNACIDFALGRVGAGRGAMAGIWPGGIGSASLALDDGLIVGALVAANPIGSPYMPDGRTYWAWSLELENEFGGCPPPAKGRYADPSPDDTRRQPRSRISCIVSI